MALLIILPLSSFRSDWGREVSVLIQINFLNLFRNPMSTLVQLGLNVFLGVMFGMLLLLHLLFFFLLVSLQMEVIAEFYAECLSSLTAAIRTCACGSLCRGFWFIVIRKEENLPTYLFIRPCREFRTLAIYSRHVYRTLSIFIDFFKEV